MVMRSEAADLTVARVGGLHGLSFRARSGLTPSSWGFAVFALDVTMLAMAIPLSELGAPVAAQTVPLYWLITFPLVVLAFFYAQGMYRYRFDLSLLDPGRIVLAGTTLAAMTLITSWALVDDAPVAVQGIRLWTFTTVYLVAGRIWQSASERHARCEGRAGNPTLILGAGKIGRLVAKRLQDHPELGMHPVGFLDDDPLFSEVELGLPVLGRQSDLNRVVDEQSVRSLIVAYSRGATEELLESVRGWQGRGVTTSFVPRMFELSRERTTVSCLGGIPLVSIHAANPRGWQFGAKSLCDRIGALVVLVLLAPLLSSLAVGVLISSGRPILYRQERVGRDGRRFGMLKFRSMRHADDFEPAPHLELAADTAPGGIEGVDRRTRFGAFIRSTSLDELPQLLNVLRGEMSFVGPRPERPEYVDLFKRGIYRYEDRQRVKSGITGWSQVNGLRGKTSIVDRVEWDNYYIENWSFWLDFKILLLTLRAVFRVDDVE